MDLNRYLVNASTVCNWDGQDQLAADNLNRIYHALDLRICPVLIMGTEPHWDPDLYDKIMGQVRGDWLDQRDRLLNVTDEQIQDYVESRAAAFHIPPPAPSIGVRGDAIDQLKVTASKM
ncbi:MAG: hypothetical protein HY028_00095 [Gammaproteobacteria bacterium]|nr:hypothetical protein [Gammaproteobacteria bacterium]